MPRFNHLEMQVSGDGVWGLIRGTGEDALIAIYNFSTEDREITLEYSPLLAKELTDLLTGESYAEVQPGQAFTLSLPAATAILLTSK